MARPRSGPFNVSPESLLYSLKSAIILLLAINDKDAHGAEYDTRVMQSHTMRMRKGEVHAEPILLTITEDAAIETILEDGAEAACIILEIAPSDAKITVTQRCTVGAHARLHVTNITLGGAEVSHDFVAHVTGEEGMSSVDWIFYGKGAERQTLSAHNVFDARNGGGEITVHGVVEERAQTSFNGMIEITPKGGGTNTYLTETLLMLDPTAKVDAIPGLEIKTNDVKASHSATVTNVSEEDLFYLAARGIALREGRRMIIEGFLSALAERIPEGKTRALVQREIAKKYAY